MKKIIFLIMAVILTMQAKTYKYTNSLINEESPYLLQHAHNPVNWYAWSKEAFDKAKKENKLIFLSIGYSTCHWCHVMERESFENEAVAKILNDNYIAIKVDREEMPSIDKHFQNVYYLMHKRGGGWPLTIILTPDAKPFFSATYIPTEPKYGRAGLIQVLEYFAKLNENDPKKLKNAADKVEEGLRILESKGKNQRVKLSSSLANDFVSGVLANYDSQYRGIGVLPKFPHASTINTLLVIYELDKNRVSLKMADEMLEAMAEGGIYDQIEGGFFRYSTDEKWMIPHFEKMLYTNAELLSDYVKAYKITKKPLYKKIIKELVAFIAKRFEKDGVFFSASDADSLDAKTGKKEEGAYFVYSYKEAKKALEDDGIKDSKGVLKYYGITKSGNFEGKNNPYINSSQKPEDLKLARAALLKIRDKRAYPFVDEKILTSWNALYIKALFEASFVDGSHKKDAKRSLDILLGKIYKNSILYHQILPGKSAKVEANLEDYSFLIDTLIEAYEKTFEKRYLDLANTLLKKAIEQFYKDGVWYDSMKPFKVRATLESSSYVSSLGVMADDLLKLALLKDSLPYQSMANEILENNSEMISKYPSNFPKAVSDTLSLKSGYIVIKAKSSMINGIKDEVLKEISYPFILYKAVENSTILACKIDSCFAYGDDMAEVIKKIKQEIR